MKDTNFLEHLELACGRTYRGPVRKVKALSRMHMRGCQICQQPTEVMSQVVKYDKLIMPEAHIEKAHALRRRMESLPTDNPKDREFMEELADTCQADMVAFPLEWNSAKKRERRIEIIGEVVSELIQSDDT
jgi:hypothetical protein